MTWVLRSAADDDLEAIMRIERSTFATDAWSDRGMRSELADRRTHYLVAVPSDEPGAIIGYAGLLAPRGATDADIQTIAVVEGARRGGLGRALMTELVREARDRGAERVFLEVRADNPGAQRLYEGLGFEPISVRPRYYMPDGVDAIVMRLELPQVRSDS